MLNGPQKIILVNAGRYDYAEVELGGSLQIVGPNNTGKTTLINTLQFLYVDDLRTMDFGSYSLEQTLAYYFPGQYSYVLFECLGVTGRCVIGWRGQSKTSGDDPERFCYLGPYETDDFFDAKHRVREPRDVKQRLSGKDFRLLKSAQEHREALLPPSGADVKGFGLVALRDTDRFRRFRESLKDLLSLSTISQDEMRERLLTLADVRSDVPALDARKLFGDDYDQIRRRRDGLARFNTHKELVRELVQKFTGLAKARGELVVRWSDLRQKRLAFERAHEEKLAALGGTMDQQAQAATVLSDTIKDRGKERDALIVEKGVIESKLGEIETQGEAFKDFNSDLAETSRQNLKREEIRLSKLLGEAETESREKAEKKVTVLSGMVRDAEQNIRDFDRLAVTALRQHFSDDELDRAFRVLNFGLLRTPVGTDGITLRDEARLLKAIRAVAGQVRDGMYESETVRIVLLQTHESVADMANVDRLREQSKEHSETLARWQRILKAINERETLTAQLTQCQTDLGIIEKQLFAYDAFVVARAEEPRFRRNLKTAVDNLAELDGKLLDLAGKKSEAEKKQREAEHAVQAENQAHTAVLKQYQDCRSPTFAREVSVDDLPENFDSAIALFLNQQSNEKTVSESVGLLLKSIAQFVGEEFNGADDNETVKNLAAELDALADKTEMLEKAWTHLIEGLRGTFKNVLDQLDDIRSAVTDLNKQFAKVRVSNLKGIKLDVLEAGDLVSWIRRLVNLQQPGLFDDDTQLDQTLRNFRQKLADSPLISFSQLFSLGITVEGEDGVKHHYQDLKQIESHGTTIAVKVLFNLLVLRRYLREDQCVVPFFLDEVQALDPANRQAILDTARKLGFLAITAAPEAITEVDALYFLQPQQGRIVLRHRHKYGIKLAAQP